MLKEELREDYLGHGLKFLQRTDAFCFGCDGVELANFVQGGPSDLAVDLGCGSGIISVLLAGKKGIRVVGVEIQPFLAELAQKNAEINNLTDKMTVANVPMQEFSIQRATIVVANPPYRKVGSGEKQKNEAIAIARHEIKVTLKEVIATAARLLSTGGRFYIINQTERMGETISLCTEQKLEPKELQVLTPDDKKSPHLFMLKCIKDGKSGLSVRRERVVKVTMEE